MYGLYNSLINSDGDETGESKVSGRNETRVQDFRKEIQFEIKSLENRLTIKLGSMMAVGIGLLGTLFTIFHFWH